MEEPNYKSRLDLNEIRGGHKHRKDPTMTFIGGMIIGGLVFGMIGFFIGYNIYLYGLL